MMKALKLSLITILLSGACIAQCPTGTKITVTTTVSPALPFPATSEHPAGEPRTIYLNYPSCAQKETLTASASGGRAPYSYTWGVFGCHNERGISGSVYTFVPDVSYACSDMNDNAHLVFIKVMDADGCIGNALVTLNVVNPFVGTNVKVCHNSGGLSVPTAVAPADVNTHLSHGDGLGNCPIFK